MIPAISQVCSLASSFENDIDQFAAGHCPAVEVWLTKLETYLETHSPRQVSDLLASRGIVAPVASFQGGLLTSQGEPRREAWKLLGQRLQLCHQVGIKTLVVACDIARPLTQDSIQRARVSLVELARAAAEHEMRVALEFQAAAALGNNLQTAAALVEEVGSPHLGICLDVFHYQVGPSKPEDLMRLSAANLFHVQFCDLGDTPRELATDSDRILPGDGTIPLELIVERLGAIGYTGLVSVEVLNPRLWEIPTLQLGEIAITALRKVLGQAEMG